MTQSDHPNPTTYTICICTRNRVRYLGPTIEAVLKQELPNGRFEILVVDNGSTDGTSEMVAARFGKDNHVPVQCIREETPGLSRARNRAIAETASDILVFLDDDAIPEPGWLSHLSAVYDDIPDVAVVGGRVTPVFEAGRPEYLPAGIFTPNITNAGLRRIYFPEYPHGANIAFRRSVFDSAGGFREDLGYSGSSLVPAEETELLMRLEKNNAIIYYEPRANVRHIIPKNRTTKRYLRRLLLAVPKGFYEVEKTRRNDYEDWGFREIGSRLVVSLGNCAVALTTLYIARFKGGLKGFASELKCLTRLGRNQAILRDTINQLINRINKIL